ncbi:hypothetical protein [Alicyclobacillus sp. SP_1]|uniref:hypothetical protein n=1 Tax=Alicyclobacillus sp. SP_1 TaxID=2942475 RepID=UPI00215769C6|nr:hypothetical protein [Alicyclobacillus sp. SP_1]
MTFVLEDLYEALVREVDERLDQNRIQERLQAAFPSAVERMFDEWDRLLLPLQERFAAYPSDIMADVWRVERTDNSYVISLWDRQLRLQAGDLQVVAKDATGQIWMRFFLVEEGAETAFYTVTEHREERQDRTHWVHLLATCLLPKGVSAR